MPSRAQIVLWYSEGYRKAVFVADAMAWALHRNGRDAEALTFADQAAALGWRNATFAYHRGMILAALGERRDEWHARF